MDNDWGTFKRTIADGSPDSFSSSSKPAEFFMLLRNLTLLSLSRLHLEISHQCQLVRCNGIPRDQSPNRSLVGLRADAGMLADTGLLADEPIGASLLVQKPTRLTAVLDRGSELFLSRCSWFPGFEGNVCLVCRASRDWQR